MVDGLVEGRLVAVEADTLSWRTAVDQTRYINTRQRRANLGFKTKSEPTVGGSGAYVFVDGLEDGRLVVEDDALLRVAGLAGVVRVAELDVGQPVLGLGAQHQLDRHLAVFFELAV